MISQSTISIFVHWCMTCGSDLCQPRWIHMHAQRYTTLDLRRTNARSIHGNMASHTSGYQGFRSFAVQPCSTLKPGESYEQRGSKFSKMGSHIITPAQYNRVGRHSFESVASQSTQTVQPDDYHVPDKRGKGTDQRAFTPKKLIAVSTYQHDFVSYDDEQQRLVATDISVFERAFQTVLAETEGSNNGVELSHVPRIVSFALGATVSPRLRDHFVSAFDRGAVTTSPFKDNITWEAFRVAIDHVVAALGHTSRKDASSWRPSGATVATKVIPSTTPSSSHNIDFGRYGEQPLDRPYMRRRGMASTTDDLQDGTAKETFHIPGYAGFLPRTTHNPDAVDHSQGTNLRQRNGDLRLYHSDNIPGYTGHKPVDSKNYRGECRAGSNDLTSTGSSYKPHL